MPDEVNSPGILFWRRPTLARPIAVLPSGLQRFTSVFGMGTGGATALGSPECGTAPAVSLRSQRRKREAESLETISSFQRTPVSLASTYRSSFRLRTADATTELRFVLRSFGFLCLPSRLLGIG